MAKTPLNELTAQELVATGDLRRDLFNLRLQKATARLDKPHRIKEIRREIARCETRLAALRVAGAKAA